MKLDTSEYYPKSPLDDDPELNADPKADTGADPAADLDAELQSVEQTVSEEIERENIEQLPTVWEDAVTGVSNVLSWVLVPLLMPVYGILLAFGLSILAYISVGTRMAFVAMVAGINLLLPMVLILLLKKLGVVHDVGLNERKERFLPYMVSILCLVSTAILLHFKGAPMWLVMFFYGGALAGLIELVINNWWKISVHAAGMAGIVALLTYLLIHADYADVSTATWLLIAVGLSGLLGAARIWLGRHTLGQVLAGYAVGFSSVYLLMLI